jgi:hypothetical protein
MPFVLIKKTDNYLKVFITVAFIFIIIIIINEYKEKKSSKKFTKESFNESSSKKTYSIKSDASSIKPFEKSVIKPSFDKSSSDKSSSDKSSSDKLSSDKSSSDKSSSDKLSSDKSSSDKSSSDKSNVSSIKPFEKSVIKSSFDQTKSYTLGVCSKNCCSTQWKTHIDVTEGSKVKSTDVGPGKKYLTSNMTCNNGVINTGCVCISDETKKMFNNRGFVKEVPMSNGLLDADYTISPFTYPKQLNSLDTKDNYYMISNFSTPIDDNLIDYYNNKPIDKFTTDQLISYPIGISDRS